MIVRFVHLNSEYETVEIHKHLVFCPILEVVRTGLTLIFFLDLMKNLNLERNYLRAMSMHVIFMKRLQVYIKKNYI